MNIEISGSRRAKMAAIYRMLLETYPEAFYGKDSPDTKPLKIGIDRDLMMIHGDLKPSLIRTVIYRYTQKDRYLRAVARGEYRFGLDGKPAGDLTYAHKVKASFDLGRRQHRDERKAAAV